MAPFEVAINQRGSAHIGCLVDDGGQVFVLRDFAGEMMVHIKNGSALCQHRVQRGTVFIHRHVKDGNLVSSSGVHIRQQVDVPFHTGHQRGFPRFGFAQLKKGANAIRIPVEEIVIHIITEWRGRRLR